VTGWTTREAAEKCGLTQYTLRWYERIGLLDRVERTADGRRRFSDSDLDWLMLLSKLRATRMPVRDMLTYAELVRSGAREQERIDLLRVHRERVRQAQLAGEVDARYDPEVIAYIYTGLGNFVGMRWADWTAGGQVPADVLDDVLEVLARGLPPRA